MGIAQGNGRADVFCDARSLRAGAAHAFGAGYAKIDVAPLADRLARARGWQLGRVRLYLPGGPADEGERVWLERLARSGLTINTATGLAPVRIALDAFASLRDPACSIIMVLGGGPGLEGLAEATRAAARQQGRDIRFASAYAPSTGPLGRPVPSADMSLAIARNDIEKSLVLESGPRPPRRFSPPPAAPGTSVRMPVPAEPAARPRSRPLRALYGMGIAATVLALVWEDVVMSGGIEAAVRWDGWRWGVSVALAAARAMAWPLYWLARAFGIEAG